MEAPSENRSARMRHHHEDDTLLFPKRPPDNLSLDLDSGRHAKVFSDNVMSGSDYTNSKASQNRAKFLIIGGFFCFLFLLATVSIYSSLSEQEDLSVRSIVESDIEAEYLPEDEVIEESASEEDGAAEGVTAKSMESHPSRANDVIPGHVAEGGDEINDLDTLQEDFDDDLIIPEIEPVEETKNEENSVVDETDDVSEISEGEKDKEVFIMDVNGIRFEIGISQDGDFDLPDGLVLNPHVRQHWALIQNTLGLDYYDDESDKDDNNIELDEEIKLEPPLPDDNDTLVEVEAAPPVEANAVRMPDGLLFDAPSATDEHEHGEGCDPVSVDVKDTMKELTAGDEVQDGEESAEDPK